MRFGGFETTGPRATRVSAPRRDGLRPRSAHGPTRAAARTPVPHSLLTRSAHPRCRERHADHLRASYPARTLAAEPGRQDGTPQPVSHRNNESSSVR
ncbi:hypothetical protein C6376_20410 [Streptomyces sp. P3]|nr:hypothetical protein C6376_20410 [Streptomyces sp. P3]